MVWPRDNFNNIFNSMVTCFIVIIAEDWNMTMYQYVRALDTNGTSGRALALTYFISLFVLGNTIMLALFTALLLKAQSGDLEKVEKRIKEKANKKIVDNSEIEEEEDTTGLCDSCKKSCSRQNCSKKCTDFGDSFVNIFGGESALRKRQKARKQKDPRSNASPISGNAIAPTTLQN